MNELDKVFQSKEIVTFLIPTIIMFVSIFIYKPMFRKLKALYFIVMIANGIVAFSIVVSLINGVHIINEAIALISWFLFLGVSILFLILAIRKKRATRQPVIEEDFDNTLTPDTMQYLMLRRGEVHPLNIHNPFRHIFVTGGSGAGKSKSFVIPTIAQTFEKGWSCLLYDYEFPVLSRNFEAYGQAYNTERYYINFNDMSRTHRVNPIDPSLMPNATFAREYATAIIDNLIPSKDGKPNFWTSSAISLLHGCIWYLKREKPELCTLPHAISMILYPDKKRLIEVISQNLEVKGIVASIYSSILDDAKSQTAGVVGTLQNAISTLYNPEVFWVLSGSDFTLDLNNPEQPKSLAVGNVPQAADTYAPVISLVFSSALKNMNQQFKHPSECIIDEGSTLIIKELERVTATARKNKLGVFYATQDVSQMRKRYGDIETEMLMSNFANHFYGKTTNPKTAELYSRAFGKEDRTYETTSHSQSDSASGGSTSETTSQSIQQREVYKPQEFMHLPTGKFIGFTADANHSMVNIQFEEYEGVSLPIPQFSTVTQVQIMDNFKCIQEDVELLLEFN